MCQHSLATTAPTQIPTQTSIPLLCPALTFAAFVMMATLGETLHQRVALLPADSASPQFSAISRRLAMSVGFVLVRANRIIGIGRRQLVGLTVLWSRTRLEYRFLRLSASVILGKCGKALLLAQLWTARLMQIRMVITPM
jgi:hypothetical protein